MADEQHQCTHDGCTSTDTMPCYLPGEDEPNDYLCDEHIRHSGYCMGCGMFWGGVESFDFGNGFCEHCNAEFENDDEYDDDLYFGWSEYPGDWYDASLDYSGTPDADTPTHKYIGPEDAAQ